ncbi:MAG: patatin-like phospholipase family protein, partial [Bacteroidaceae bacterium]|nr:patatin-like phospholipase family protein [Bacteroidaceae bacterium]
SGNSMGALIGGLYAAGKLQEVKQAVDGLNRKTILKLFNISLGLDHIANGEKLMALLDELIGDTRIEDLPIKFCCNASDVVSGKEFVFREGLLKDAIRASISIPCVFKPVQMGEHIFVDGSVHNTLPLDLVERGEDDLLVAVNVSAPDDEPFQAYLKKYGEPENGMDNSIWHMIPFLKSGFSANYMNMALRVAKMSVQNNTQMALKITPPDIYVEVPMNKFSLFDFDKGAEIIPYGHEIMEKALKERAEN